MAEVVGLFVSPGADSGRSEACDTVVAVEDHGLEGCAHARPGGKRQVLFVSKEHLDAAGVEPGAIRENVTVTGDDVQQWPVGHRVRIGDAVFEVTMDCPPCERMDALRPGLRAELEGKRGTLARVVTGGTIVVGNAVEPA